MSRSRARLDSWACGERHGWSASATAPQRWVVRRDGAHIDAVHQLLGDGVFGGDVHRVAIHARPGAHVVVRSLAATPLRPGPPSALAVRASVAGGASLLHLPGALIPQSGSRHASSVFVKVADGGAAVIASCVTAGRVAMGEYGAFDELRLRTSLRVAGTLAFQEDARLPGGAGVRALFGAGEAALSVLAGGATPAADPTWWRRFEGAPGVTGGASALRTCGASYRALCRSLGDAQALLAAVEDALMTDREGPAAGA